MSLRKAIRKMLGEGNGPGYIEGLLPEREFRHILDRERALADRYGLSFCLLVFRAPDVTGQRTGMMKLGRILAERLRHTDVAGWLDDRQLAAILPHTPLAGAQCVADRICELAFPDGPRPCYELIPYPTDAVSADKKDADPASVGGTGGPTAVNDKPLLAAETTEAAAAPEIRTPAAAATTVDEILAPPFPAWKRALDILLASTALVVLSPLMLGVAILIKIVSPGPVLFEQERVGFLRSKFMCWKFRTMHLAADIATHQQHFDDLMKSEKPMTKLDLQKDPRVIPFGRFLRASGIDELPQLINVLRGEMSFIGPRPCIQYEFDNYRLWQKRRCDARPGLTGLWQVSGKNRTTLNQMMWLDISYARDRSLWKDIRIVFRTFPAVVREVLDTFNPKRRPGS